MLRVLSFLVFVITLTGCRERSTRATANQGLAASDQARLLCLLSPGPDPDTDVELRRAQELAVKRPDKIDNWVAAGHGWVRKARATTSPGFYGSAEGCARVVLAWSPEDPLANNLLGMVRLNEHRFSEAESIARRLVSANPQDPTAWGTLSDALLELGEYEAAASAVQKMMDLKPNLPAYVRFSHLAWLRGNTEQAKESIRLAIDAGRGAKDPEPMAWVIVQAAMIFWHQGDYEGALAGFNQALRVFPDYPPALVGAARVDMAMGDPAKAANRLSLAFSKSPLAETAWLLADARKASGNDEGARASYADVERIGRATDPRTLALFLATQNRNAEEAVRLAREEQHRRPDILSDDALGWALYRLDHLEEARVAVERATRLGTPDARLLFHAGAVFTALGDPRGRSLLMEAVRLNPHFDAQGAAEAASLLAHDDESASRD
jgi:tetratricopeptide (TPR) repeat protein